MQPTKLRSVLNLVAVNKEFIRNVAVNATAIKEKEETNIKSWKDIPGPPSLPVIGQLHNFLPGGMLYNIEGADFSKILFEKYGPIIKLDGMFGRPTLLFLFDAEGTAQVLRGENWMPVRPGFYSLEYYRKKHNKESGQSQKPTGLITDHGDLWKEFRSTVNPVMLQPKTIKLYSNVLDEVAMDMIARLRSLRDEKNVIQSEFDVEMNLWALESIGSVALGCRLNCFDPNLAEGSPERELIRCIHEFFKISEELDFKPSPWKYISTPTFRRAMKLYEEQENLIKYFVNKGIENIKANKKVRSDDEKGVLEKLLDINEDVAVIMASDMLFAGVDTASNTVTATLYLLAKNPEKQRKLREQLNSDEQKKPYLKACIKEAMRILPVVTGNIRETSKEYNILGYHIPKGMQVAFSHYDMSMMEEHYPQAKQYIPERWLADKADPMHHGNAHPFAFGPFGFGVRSCIGRRIAELEVETFLARMIQSFHVDWTGPPIRTVQTSLNYMKGPFHFTFKDI